MKFKAFSRRFQRLYFSKLFQDEQNGCTYQFNPIYFSHNKCPILKREIKIIIIVVIVIVIFVIIIIIINY